MPVLVDSNVLLRIFDEKAGGHAESLRFVKLLRNNKRHPFAICAQVLIEFRVVATRPLAVNGLRMQSEDADQILDDWVELFLCLDEPPDVAARWREVLKEIVVEGKQCHDARLVTVMRAHQLAEVITLNPRHLSRFNGIKCYSPQEAYDLGLHLAAR